MEHMFHNVISVHIFEVYNRIHDAVKSHLLLIIVWVGWVAMRPSKSCPCLALTSGCIQRDIASSSSVGTLAGVGKPNFAKDERSF
jgi:hypothetical protein